MALYQEPAGEDVAIKDPERGLDVPDALDSLSRWTGGSKMQDSQLLHISISQDFWYLHPDQRKTAASHYLSDAASAKLQTQVEISNAQMTACS